MDHLLIGLRSIRHARRLTLAQVAVVIGVKPNSYSRLEAGNRRLYFDKAFALAKRLGVHVDDLTKDLSADGAAALLCDQRDKEAIANGTFDRSLWTPGTPDQQVTAPPSQVPAPPTDSGSMNVPPPPPLDDTAAAAAVLDGWDDAS